MLSESHSNQTRNAQNKRLPTHREDGQARPSEPAEQTNSVPPTPALDWNFFSHLSTPGECTAYSLHDGTLAFLEADVNVSRIWGLTASQTRAANLALLVSDDNALKNWIFNLDPNAQTPEFKATLTSPVS